MAVLRCKSPHLRIAAVLKTNALCIFYFPLVFRRREYVGS